jgi:glycosyltransferase involved in cell wall biosynthesis
LRAPFFGAVACVLHLDNVGHYAYLCTILKQKDMPKISIITPAYNSENTIHETIGALLGQTFPDFEYIVIDGASKDRTVEKIKNYIPEFEKKGVAVHIVSEPDKGVYDAMNKGIALARGELVGITNSDDWYEDNALEVMWNKFTNGKVNRLNCMLYGIERVWKDGRIFNVQRRGAAFISESVLPHSAFFVSKAVYDRLGAFDLSVKVLADYDFICRCASRGVDLEEVDVVISNFRLGGISSSYFDFYSDYYRIKYKYGFIDAKKYKELKFVLKVKKLINKLVKRW